MRFAVRSPSIENGGTPFLLQAAHLPDAGDVGGGLGDAFGGFFDAGGELERDVEGVDAVADELAADGVGVVGVAFGAERVAVNSTTPFQPMSLSALNMNTVSFKPSGPTSGGKSLSNCALICEPKCRNFNLFTEQR